SRPGLARSLPVCGGAPAVIGGGLALTGTFTKVGQHLVGGSVLGVFLQDTLEPAYGFRLLTKPETDRTCLVPQGDRLRALRERRGNLPHTQHVTLDFVEPLAELRSLLQLAQAAETGGQPIAGLIVAQITGESFAQPCFGFRVAPGLQLDPA